MERLSDHEIFESQLSIIYKSIYFLLRKGTQSSPKLGVAPFPLQSHMLAERRKIIYLESLRGLAAFSVLLTHIRDDFFNDHASVFHGVMEEHAAMIKTYDAIMFLFFHTGGLSVYLFWVGLWLADFKQSSKWDLSPGKRRFVLVAIGLYVLAVWLGFRVMYWTRLPQLDALLSSIALLAIVDCGPIWIQRILSCRPLAFIGRVSFGVYLLHQLVLCSLGASLFLTLNQALSSRWMATTIAAAVSIPAVYLCGWVFTVLVDVPSVRLGKTLGRVFR